MSALRIAVAGLATLTALPSAAADQGFYFGVQGGRADYEFTQPQLGLATIPIGGFFPVTPAPLPTFGGVVNPIFMPVAGSTAAQVGFADRDADDADTAWGATVGYRIFDYAAVELAYLDLGSLEARDEFALPVSLGGGTMTLKQTLKTSGPSVSVLGMMPVAERWDLFLRVGILFADQQLTQSITSTGVIFGGSNSNTYGSDTALWGAGAQYNVAARWTVRLDFQRYSDVGSDSPVGETDIDLISLGVLYRL